jgi:hypothetical protein
MPPMLSFAGRSEDSMTERKHLAQINLARMIAPIDDPIMADFVAQVDSINALADRSPGFVWRLQSPAGNATDLHPLEDPTVLVNMSVWESLESLHAYVFASAHTGVMRQRKRWFKKYDGPYYALWWIEPGHIPTIAEGVERVRLLAERGPSPDSFWFGAAYGAPEEVGSPPGQVKLGAPR